MLDNPILFPPSLSFMKSLDLNIAVRTPAKWEIHRLSGYQIIEASGKRSRESPESCWTSTLSYGMDGTCSNIQDKRYV